jgi:hypothetical protein
MNNSWFEVYLGANEPVEGSDYGPGTTALGGFKWSGWEAGCAGLDLFDGTLRNDGCMPTARIPFLLKAKAPWICILDQSRNLGYCHHR